jgi:DNA-directed RNA polymerase subunit RPC12/RpoP
MLFSEVNLERKEVEMQAYCMKCRKKVEIKNPKAIKMKNKRPATQGVCPKCGTKVFRIGK